MHNLAPSPTLTVTQPLGHNEKNINEFIATMPLNARQTAGRKLNQVWIKRIKIKRVVSLNFYREVLIPRVLIEMSITCTMVLRLLT